MLCVSIRSIDYTQHTFIWALMQENLSLGFANNKGADQPAHLHSLISTFVIRLLESIISKLATSEISLFQLVCVAEETGFSLAFSETPKTGFLALRPTLWKMPDLGLLCLQKHEKGVYELKG